MKYICQIMSRVRQKECERNIRFMPSKVRLKFFEKIKIRALKFIGLLLNCTLGPPNLGVRGTQAPADPLVGEPSEKVYQTFGPVTFESYQTDRSFTRHCPSDWHKVALCLRHSCWKLQEAYRHGITSPSVTCSGRCTSSLPDQWSTLSWVQPSQDWGTWGYPSIWDWGTLTWD